VFLANLGELAAHSARSTWIRNFLAAGGIEAVASAPLHNSNRRRQGVRRQRRRRRLYLLVGRRLCGTGRGHRRRTGRSGSETRPARRASEGAGSGAEGGRHRHVHVRRHRCDRRANQPARGPRCPRLTSPRRPCTAAAANAAPCGLSYSWSRVGSASATAACARKRWPDPSPCWPRCRGPSSPGARAQPSTFRSSSRALRDFCSACGTPLSYRKPGGAIIELLTGTFDHPERVPPTYAVGIESKLAWVGSYRRPAGQDHARQHRRRELAVIESFQHPDDGPQLVS
jgi:hypothetical protein